MDLAPCGMVTRAVRELLSDCFVCSDILLVPGTCNSAAHSLASLGLSRDPGVFCIWTNPLPEFVKSFVACDVVEHMVYQGPRAKV
jgi:hypothetical protein